MKDDKGDAEEEENPEDTDGQKIDATAEKVEKE
jgi:hypothetical protein